jgi:adenosylcobinamide kinase / adenosylcobinamide-phosphate guanylyltransferase
VILDCLSLWVSNCMFADYDDETIEEEANRVAEALALRCAHAVVVSNEVGMGIVPDNPLARRYRDVLGRVNALFAARADAAWFCVSGRVIRLDPPPA